jgi:hypothetical protein
MSWKRFELRAKHAAARRTKGVVGNTGRTIPTAANISAAKPAAR